MGSLHKMIRIQVAERIKVFMAKTRRFTVGCLTLARLRLLTVLTLLLILILLNQHGSENPVKRVDNMCTNSDLKHFPNGTVDFRGFNNTHGHESGCYVVPNIIHLIKFNQPQFSFIELICLNSMLTNHKPPVLNIHTNVMRFEGRYWRALQRLPEFHRIRIVHLSQPQSIFNQSLKGKWLNWHSGDVARLQILQKYGGIYLDSDVYVTQSLDSYRRFEFVVEWNMNSSLGSQTLMAHKDARITPLWLGTWKHYDKKKWYYNGGLLPTRAVLEPNQEKFHRVYDHFGTSMKMLEHLYHEKGWKWKKYPAIHTFVRLQKFQFNEWTVFKYRNSPIKEMILSVMPNFLKNLK